MSKVILVAACCSGIVREAQAQVNLTFASATYTQNFDGLPNSGTPTWTDNTTLAGWYASNASGSISTQTYSIGNGSGTAGGHYSFGTTSATDRAFGNLTTATAPNTTLYMGLRLKNNDASKTITSITIRYTGEEWRENANNQSLVFGYLVGATSLTAGTWTAATGLDFAPPVAVTASARDGNNATYRTTKTLTINFPTPIAVGQEVWIRWSKAGNNNSCGLAVDDLSVAATYYCLPTYALGGTGDFMTSISLGTLTQATASNASPYFIDYSAIQTAIPSLARSSTPALSITYSTDGTQYNGVWVDFDQNGTFATSEFFTTGSVSSGSTTVSVTITVPSGATLGQTRMRIRGGDDSQPTSAQACGTSASSNYGSGQDFIVNITPAAGCTPTYSTTYPYSQSFESWSNCLSTTDVPSANYLNTPSTGDNSWRRNDQQASASWVNPTLGTYSPASSVGSFSARFHSYQASSGAQGSLDFYLNCTAGASTKQIKFDYVNTSGSDVLAVLVSTTGPGGTFTQIGSNLTTSATFVTQTFNFTSTSATTVIRLRATSDFGTTDIGVDNFIVQDQGLVNDLVCNATTLVLGANGPYANVGATIESGEPAPPGGNCNAQTAWCEGGITNTIWFKFTAPASGRVSIDVNGFDTQAALWSATSCGNILVAGQSTLLAANDDGSSSPVADGSLLNPVNCLTSGTVYYLQVDGYNGATGSATVTLTDLGAVTASLTPSTAQSFCTGGATTARTVSTNAAGTAAGATLSWTVVQSGVTGGSSGSGSSIAAQTLTTTGAASGTATYTGVATIAALSPATCSFNSTPVVVMVNPLPVISSVTATPTSVCNGANSQLLATVTPTTYVNTTGTYALETCGANAGPSGDDFVMAATSIGFNFTYFGVTYSQFTISTNGNIQLGDGTGTTNNPVYSNVWTDVAIPNAAVPNNFIALAWDDWNPSAGQVTYGVTGSAPNRKLVVCYNTTGRGDAGSGGTGTLNGQIVLEETTNKIYLNSTSITSNVSLTQGIEDQTGASGFAVSGRNSTTAWTATNEQQVFTPPPTYSWLPVTFLSSTTIANPVATAMTSNQNYTVTVTSANGCVNSGSTGTINVQPVFSAGSVGSGDQSFCTSGTPSAMSVTGATGSASFSYQWYSQSGIVTCPSGSSTSGWTSLGTSGNANTATYTPPATISSSTTYACFVTPGGSPTCGTAQWAGSCRKITIVTAANAGIDGSTTRCLAGAPFQPIFNLGGSPQCPGTWSGPSGYASTDCLVFLNPATALSGTYIYTATGTAPCPNVSANVVVTILPTFNAGSVGSGDQSFCASGTPNAMSVTGATGSPSFSYQWYSQSGIVSCPSGSSLGGWTSLGTSGNANTATYTPPGAISASTTYACFVTPGGSPTCGTAQWASNCRKITVNPLPTVTCGSYGPFCSADPDVLLGGSPGTGSWSGTGVVGTGPYYFDPSAGTQQLTYTYSDGTCSNFCNTTITVNPTPAVTCGTYGPYCSADPDVLLGGSPGTGTWSGTGVVGTGPYYFDPSAGTQQLTYTYSDGTCSNFCNTTITVNTTPTVSCGSYGPYCSNDPDVNLGGSPAGGTWTGNGVSVSAPYTFDPSAGTQQLTYTYSDGTCSDLCNTTITVNTAPDITCPANSTVCTSTPSYALTGGSPAGVGGTYSGTGVSGNNFDAATAGPGTHTITYSYVDGNGCTNTSCTFTITVEDADTDEDGTPDYCDGCPLDDNKTAPGTCGCGNPDPGSACDDGLSTTGEDTVQPDCNCLGVPVDCNYVVNGPDLPGTACDDGNPDTWGDTWSVDCLCEGQLEDCEGIVGGTAYPGTPCDDGDGDTGDDTYQTDCSCVGQVIDCMEVAGGTDLPGTPCNDNNNNTADDEWQPDCECVGTVICAGNLVALEIGTDGKGEETDWAILPSGGGGPVCSGPAVDYADNAVIIEPCCLPNGCYILRVYDSFGDGMTVGGYRLKDANSARIIDNWQSGAFTSTSAIANNGTFCVPIGTDAMQTSSCDALNLMPTSVVAAVPNGAVTGQYGLGSNTDDGYQFWIYDPDGSYSRMIFKSITNPGQPGTPAGPTAPAYLKLSSLTTLPVPTNVKLNIKVRSRVNGLNAEFGPACTMMIDVLNQCPTTSLVSTSGSQFSCGATGKVVNASGNTGKIFCTAVAGANKYQWRFQKGSYTRTIASANTVLVLGAWGTNPLLCGTFTYNVSVHASFDNGATYCPYGAICTVGITNSAPNPCTAGGGSLLDVEVETGEQTISLWPNPVREGSVTLDLTGLSPEATTATVDVVDMFGKRVMALTIATDGAEELNTVLQLDDVATGLYVVNVTSGTNTFTERLVVE